MNMVRKLACGVMCFAAMIASATVTTNLDSYVEYIQSSGTQLIDTGVIGKSTVNIAADVMVLSSAGSSCFIGERPGTDVNKGRDLRLGIWINNSYKWALNCGTIDSGWIGSISYQNSRCVVSNENGRLWVAVNGGTPTKIHDGADQTFTSSLTLTMFFLNTASGLDQASNRALSARVYGLTLHDSGTLVRDFHPCRVTIKDTDAGTSVSKNGLWDEVGDRFYGDLSGGTDFTVGADIPTFKFVVLPIPDQTNETFGASRPECVVSNMSGNATWTVGGAIVSPLFDVEYADNEGAGVATVTVTGKGEYAGKRATQTFNIVATKQEDENIISPDPTTLRRIVDGRYVYIFKDATAAQTVTAKRGIVLADCFLVGGGGGGGHGRAGGGGGGGGVTNMADIVGAYIDRDDTFTVAVGAGGAGGASITSKGSNGGASSLEFGLFSASVAGGGGGGSWNSTGGAAGASGGGGAPNGAGGAGIDGLGFAGAAGGGNNTGQSGGGGGAGHAGYEKVDGHSGYGGEGVSNNITGAWVFYGGGGGGGGAAQALYWKYDAGLGGLGGGGNGGTDVAGENGVDGLGGGGGGGGASGSGVNVTDKPGGNGGSGIAVLVLRPLAYVIVPIPDQIHESFDPCRPEFIVSNRLTGAKWTVGGNIASEDFDVEYENNIGAGTAKVTITGKGACAEAYYISYFNITATKYEDANIVTTDLSARRLIVDGKSVYVFTNAASAQVVTAKRGIYLTDYLVVGGGGGGGNTMAGGGGAGGVTNAAGLVGVYVDKGDTFTLSVGAGGVGCSSVSAKGGNGGKTTFAFGLIDVEVPGGGGGGSRSSTGGVAGGSGGGGAPNGAGGAGTDGFGFAGAAGGGNNTGQSGGGGGAGHAGYEKVDGHSGYGGEGVSNNITGAWVFYGGGGGGGGAAQALYWKYDAGLGGLGGGGNGGTDVAGENGVDGLGGGGGGGGAGGASTSIVNMPGGNGGVGTVIVALVPADFNIEPIPDQILVSGGAKPVPVVHSGDTLLVEGDDYTVSYTDNDKPGIAMMTITGINGFSGKSATVAFKTFVCYFVDDDAAPGGDGSEASPFAMISNAVDSAKTAIAAGAQYVEIRVAVGTYEETDFVLDAPIVIVGESRDGVEIVDNVAGKRAFTLSHEGAAVRNLTISGNGIKTNGSQGGHVRMTAGLVSNCVIKDGRAGASAGYGHGGNVYMTGGRLERCLVANGRANWGGWTGTQECYGMGLYASGGVIDSCFFKDNRDDNNNGRNYGSVYLYGTATMVNCTVTGGYSRYDTASGIYVPSANAKVVNCVAYGNYGGGAGNVYSAASNFGDKNLGRFYYCAGPFTNASCATWTVLTDEDFVNYVTYTGSTQSGKSYNELMAYFASEAYANFDWHQRLSSAIVDGGTTNPSYRPEGSATLDVDGNERVSGASVDLGCWEADQSQFECEGRLESYGALENANVTFIASAFGPSSDVVFRWDYGNGVTNETSEATHLYAYPAAGYFTVRISASSNGGLTWTEWYTVPTRVAVAPAQMFVDSNCATPAFPYKTRATAATTLGAAVGLLTNNVSRNETIIDGVDIVILRGSSSSDTGFFLTTAVTIRGETGNPTNVVIIDNVVGSRAFTLSHPDAVVSNLTISGSGLRTNGGCGGHVRIFNGLVANCVIKDGRAGDTNKGYGNGGNVWMSGGRLERCFVTGGTANSGGFAGQNSFGMGLYASGGIIDSCFFKDNRDDNNDGRNYGSVCLAGAATLINCTVTGGYSRYTEAAGIYVNAAAAKVVNCVAYGNYGNKSPIVNTAASNFGNKNLNRFYYCAAAFTNESCATWTVLTDADFVKYESFTGNTYALLNKYMTSDDYLEFDWHQKRDSKLVDRGTLDTTYRPADSATRDLDGNERVINKHIDLGCWEILTSRGFIYILR